ncbi:UDP-glucosyltransferase 2 [Pseudolycoriella hygida]|uniref:UDP-glucuronosyltransferase n=1 Tax=Pseudolycoriella hygida TaxID=35572 RepID=A0A9Q0N9F2_9DIPT|nr:UDP-glucosyltransferase 2 [Pseudolycoriella hygida]
MALCLLIIVLIVVASRQCDSANILLLEELPSPSHHLWFRYVTSALISRGHNITVVSSEVDTINVSNLHQIHMEKVRNNVFNRSEVQLDLIGMGEMHPFLQIIGNVIYATKTCEGFTISKGWQHLQNYPDSFQFHLVIHDFPASSCLLAFLSKFNYPPMIGMTAFSDFSVVPSTITSALVPSLSTHFLFKEQMTSTFFGRLQNFLLNAIVRLLQTVYVDPTMNEMVRKAVDGKYKVLPVEQLRQRASLVLINYNELIDGMVQLPPNVIGVGGLQIEEPRQLSMDFATIANNATNGLILFSLGTNVKTETLGEDRILEVLNAFGRLHHYTFLWKINLLNVTIHVPSNVYIRKWIPQNDILGHRNTRLFITHGGLLSTQEAIYNGVPMLGIPIMVDQFMNIDRSVEKGIASRMNVRDLTSDTLYEKLNEMLTNPMYKENMKIISKCYKDQKELPLDRAIWWIEWVLRNPNPFGLNLGKGLNFLQIQSIDVISFFTMAFLALAYFSFLLLRKFFILIFRRMKTNANKDKND